MTSWHRVLFSIQWWPVDNGYYVSIQRWPIATRYYVSIQWWPVDNGHFVSIQNSKLRFCSLILQWTQCPLPQYCVLQESASFVAVIWLCCTVVKGRNDNYQNSGHDLEDAAKMTSIPRDLEPTLTQLHLPHHRILTIDKADLQNYTQLQVSHRMKQVIINIWWEISKGN